MRSLIPIYITEQKLFGMLTKRVGKKKAKAMAFGPKSSFPARWKKTALIDVIGWSNNLIDIRILHLFGVELSPHQQVILINNKCKFVRKTTT